MIKYRLIAVLLINRGVVVQTRRFKRTNMVGNAFTAVDFFNSWSVDEIIVLEISNNHAQVDNFVNIVEELSRRCFVPLSVGGKIQNIGTVDRYIRAGADKVVVNTGGITEPSLISQIADSYGSQCVVVSIDGRANHSRQSGYTVMAENGSCDTGRDVLDWAHEAIQNGAGELLINSIEHDGDKRGYDLALIRTVSKAVDVPVVAMGGVGRWSDLSDGIVQGGADAVAAGNIFHYTEHSTKKAKEYLIASGFPVRQTNFYKLRTPRRVRYKPFQGQAK